MSTTAAEMIWEWWEKALLVSREARTVPAEAVQSIIESTRMVLAAQRCSKENADLLFFDFYTRIHWDWNQPTDRVFETMLSFELEQFFKDRGLSA